MEFEGLKPIEQLNVLIIDDNLLVHDLLKRALYDLEIRNIKCAENAYYGLRLCAETQFDVVICAFNVKSDKDGFHILEEMKFKGYVSKSTILIFLSSETDETLVNSIAELQPDDFWVKPLNTGQVIKRLAYAVEVKRRLFNVFECIDNKDFGKAIYYIERHILNPELKKYHPQLLRIKGECLLSLMEYQDAENYYRDLLKNGKNSWMYLGFVNALLKQNKIEEIEQLLKSLTTKVETRFATYDLLAQYYVENQDFVEAYETIKKAAALAPRNIARNKKVWDLARLNHDQREQYKATVNMAKFAKKSIHDSPELLLNVVRSGIDLALSVDASETFELLNKVDKYIAELEAEYDDIGHFKEQLIVVRARVLTAREEKAKAERLVEMQVSTRPNNSLEDNLDKVKVFHELGMREEALVLLEAVKKQIACDSLAGAVTSKFVEQEAKEKAEIHFTPKQLNSMAVEFFKKKKMAPALRSLEQALQLTPKNVKVALSLLKVLLAIHRSDGLDTDQKALASNTIRALHVGDLDETQMIHFNEIISELEQVVDGDEPSVVAV
ncbi:response regulator [Psychrosphaera aestuarii]|uniref:response regulator n=1 Tax=Psychrosphaera aestuarii TaxID=1266052 RepID=UPI001B33D97C|nr:response regulator [Psychrosphaera aestuarii]